MTLSHTYTHKRTNTHKRVINELLAHRGRPLRARNPMATTAFAEVTLAFHQSAMSFFGLEGLGSHGPWRVWGSRSRGEMTFIFTTLIENLSSNTLSCAPPCLPLFKQPLSFPPFSIFYIAICIAQHRTPSTICIAQHRTPSLSA
jgi:hypothetical protein